MAESLNQLLKQLKNRIGSTIETKNVTWTYVILGLITVGLFVGSISLFLQLTDELKSAALSNYDTAITEFITQYRSTAWTSYFVIVTDIGDALGYLIVFVLCSVLFYFSFKNWKFIAQLVSVMVLALSSNLILKQIINRARPDAEHLVTVETLSYPSGHAMMAMAFYGILIYLFWQFPWHKLWKKIITVVLVLLILSIGISRIYLGVHYPSDILGGFTAGFMWVLFCIIVFNLIKIFRKDPATL
jgi:undecaprenyl-diphosphatase